MSTQPVNGTHDHLSGDRYAVSFKLVIGEAGRPPVRATTIAARRRHAVRPAEKAAQLAYSEWLLTKLTA